MIHAVVEGIEPLAEPPWKTAASVVACTRAAGPDSHFRWPCISITFQLVNVGWLRYAAPVQYSEAPNVCPEPEWLVRVFNVESDARSRLVDKRGGAWRTPQ